MSPYRNIRVSVVRAASSLALLLSLAGVDHASAAQLPKDPCALLKPAEIQAALAPDAKIPDGVADTSALPLGTACKYTWGPRTSRWGQTEITVNVIDASKAWVGVSPDQLVQGLLAKVKAKDATLSASQISGVGDAAVFTYEERSHNAMAEAYFKKKDAHVSVQFHHGDALANKDKVIALLKQAADRI